MHLCDPVSHHAKRPLFSGQPFEAPYFFFKHGALQLLPGDGALHSNVLPTHLHPACTRHVVTALTLSRRHAKWWLVFWPHHLRYGRRSTPWSSQCPRHFWPDHWYYVLLLDTRPVGWENYLILCYLWFHLRCGRLHVVGLFRQIPKDPRDIGTYIGMGMFCAVFGTLIGTPISDVLVSQSGGFETMSIFSGVMATVGSGMVLLVKLLSGKGMWSRY